ncbi:MAG TPA: hypothetical protein VG265_07285 [Gaiellaceae bacterium]|nr:hypothetical protein [Gaiellaceae bacterium]
MTPEGNFVPRPWQVANGWHGVSRPSLSNGTAQTLPMSDEEKAAVAERERPPFGFTKPSA